MARPTKEEVKRREAAKKKVEELLGSDIKVDIKKVTQVAEKLDSLQSDELKGGNSWLEKQVSELSEKNKELEDELIKAKEDYNKLLNSKGGAPVDASAVEAGVRSIFNDMRNNYEGNNPSSTKYTQANIRVMLEKFLTTFEFLRKK
jgi:hypothetical protein